MKFRNLNPWAPQDNNQQLSAVVVNNDSRYSRQRLLARKPVILLAVFLFASVGTTFLLHSYAATSTITKVWKTSTDWTTNSQLSNVAVSNNAIGLAVVKSSTTPTDSGTDLARKHSTVASSTESRKYPAAYAFDGNLGTRWASQEGSAAQWIYVDLGAKYTINRVALSWEAAYAKAYQIQTSNDAKTWTSIYTTTTGTGGTSSLTGLTGNGRYVRMYATVRGTQWGYSLWDFQVYGSQASATTQTTYAANGTATLNFDAGSTVNMVDWVTIAPQVSTPAGTSVTFTYATSNDNQNWSSAVSDITQAADSRYLRIVAMLQTSNAAVTPILSTLTLTYNVTTAPPSSTFTLKNLSANVNGTSVTATASVAANPAVTVANYGICARNANGDNVDFGTNTNVALTTTGVSYAATKVFAPGTYTYFACVNYNNGWTNLGTTTFTVQSSSAAGALPVGVSGNWTLKFDDEFNGTALNTNNWSTVDGWSMNNVTTRTSNVSVSGGYLNLTLASSTSGAEVVSDPDSGAGIGYLLPVNGYAEARVMFPGNGTTIYNWPAWWISGPNWPAAGENDIAEGLGTLTVNYHSPSGAHNQGTIPGTWSNEFHTYGIHRKATQSDVYWDGKLVKSYPTDDNGQPESLIINIGADNQSVYGSNSTVKVDYVRAWQ